MNTSEGEMIRGSSSFISPLVNKKSDLERLPGFDCNLPNIPELLPASWNLLNRHGDSKRVDWIHTSFPG
ncbi:MAG TPA: hypothetical protein VII93_06970, partial [Anaerolineales bacterium]